MEWLIVTLFILWWLSGTLPLIFWLWGDNLTWGELLTAIAMGLMGGTIILISFSLIAFTKLSFWDRPVFKHRRA